MAPEPVPEVVIRNRDDQAVAAQILAYAAPGYRYCRDSGSWVWKGPDSWEPFPGDPAEAMIARVADKLPPGTAAPKNTPPDEMTSDNLNYVVHSRLANASTAAGIARKIRALAPSSLWSVLMRDLDTDGSVIWAGGQAYDIRASSPELAVATGAAEVHQKSARYAPVLGPTPLWDALREAAFPDPEIRLWAEWEACGAVTASGGKALIHLAGVKDTAKTTVMQCYADVLGSYAVQIPRALLTGQPGHEGTVLQLAGARLAWFDEKPRRGQVAQEFLKDLTGGGSFRARPPHGRGAVEGRFTATVVMASNDELPLTDGALLGRVRRVPMTGDPRATRAARLAIRGLDGNYTGAWKAEAPAVLGRMIVQCSLRMNGWTVDMPASAASALLDAAAEQDTAAIFIAETLEAASGAYTPSGDIHAGYVEWCKAHSIGAADIMHVVPFGKRLASVFGAPRHTNRGNGYPCRARQPGLL